MKAVINNSKLGNITYEESFWTGSKSIIVNGKLLRKKDKDVYYVYKTDGNQNYTKIDGVFYNSENGDIYAFHPYTIEKIG